MLFTFFTLYHYNNILGCNYLKKNSIFLSFLIIIIILCLVLVPEIAIKSSLSGITVWATAILPALLPFFFFTKLLGELGYINEISGKIAPLTKRLYNTSGISGYVYLMSILSGYPVGAKLTCDLYENKFIDLGQAHRIITFTSTSGPLFILGTVAVGMFKNKTIGYVVLISHFISALINGLFYRKYMLKETGNCLSKEKFTQIPNKNILENCMLNSIKSILIVGGYISVFFMLITLVNHFNLYFPLTLMFNKIFPFVNSEILVAILNGIIELTRGCLDLSLLNLNPKLLSVILSAIISFGGISINLQALTFLRRINIKISFYFLQKITHCAISIILAFLIGFFVFG